MTNLNFSPEQRMIVALLCDLYKKPDDREFSPKDLKLITSAIYGGHDWAIEWEFVGLFPEAVDKEADVRFVGDVLDMWEFIELGWSKLSTADKEKVRSAVPYLTDPQFIGFDGNNESSYMGIAQMLVQEMGRFATFKGRSLNSHSQTLDRYNNMLKSWPAIRSTLHMGEMSTDQLIELLSRS